NLQAPGQQITLLLYKTDSSNRSFAVEEINFAPGTPFNLQGGVQGAANGAHGTVQSSRLTTFQGFPADEFVIASTQGRTTVYIKALAVHTSSHALIILVGGTEDPPLGYDKFKA